ncbi:MAG: helix-turn-helix domain-containing protein [Tepidanaerobacteraceae bacterium]|jgi:transcriptional regulator with XRE-family HTH domain|nr:helix-turn-helix domain-containing protein [Tepidanaerobacteraceae bacterium]
MDIGSRLKQLRKAKGLTALELAEKIDITREHLSAVENNMKSISLITLQKICDVLGITLAEFFSAGENTLSPEYMELINNAKVLTKKQLKILNEFLKALKEKNDNV